MRPDRVRGAPPSAVTLAVSTLLIASSTALSACGLAGVWPSERGGEQGTQTTVGPTAVADTPAVSPTRGVALPAPGSGVVAGRLVDAVTGLPVGDAGVSLLNLGRRTISGVDGGFRFDGVAAGTASLVFGPIDGYVPRSIATDVLTAGVDLGIVPLQPEDTPTLIVPEFGGTVPGCGSTRVVFDSGAVVVPTQVSVTCIASSESLPAEAPAGRLPLAALHVAPADTVPVAAATLFVDLPTQPRYGVGVRLELLRLDLERLAWQRAGELLVEGGGRSARGRLDEFGTILVAAPQFGTFVPSEGDEPAITRFHLAAAPDGPPVDSFRTPARIVYASFDYERMTNTPVLLRTVDALGAVLFEVERPYSDRGSDAVPMVSDAGDWPSGEYVTTAYLGQPAAPLLSVPWRVVSRDEPTVAPPTLPPVRALPSRTAPTAPAERPIPPAPPDAGCSVPYGWWRYMVRPGDTLFGLAVRTGSSVAVLQRGNCMPTAELIAGQTIYLPRPPARRRPPLPPSTPGLQPTHIPLPTRPVAPLRTPTTWYTPPAAQTPAPPPPTEVPGGQAPTQAVPPATTAAATATQPPSPPPTQTPQAPTPRPFTPKPTAPQLPEPTLAPRPTNPP